MAKQQRTAKRDTAGQEISDGLEDTSPAQFTGSTRTGRKIARRAAERLIPYSLELGGKDAMIVLADADLERAANAAVWGAMFSSGRCMREETFGPTLPVMKVQDVEEAIRLANDSGYRAVGRRLDSGSRPR